MKKLAIAITAVSFLFAGCQSEILQVEEMTNEQAPGALMKSASNQSAQTCVNVREHKVFGLELVSINFSVLGVEELFCALKNAGAFDYYPKYVSVAYEGDNFVTGLGAPFGDIFDNVFSGMKTASIVTHQYAAGNGATFFRLFHLFYIDPGDNPEVDAFVTMDEAVATPYNRHLVGRINNKLEIVAGTGIFKNVSGKIINNGVIQYADVSDVIMPAILDARLHGHICY